jgi:hypothetical protein
MKYRFIALLAISVSLLTNCEVFLDCGDHASCEQSMKHLYGKNCAILINNVQITEPEAVTNCQQTIDYATTYDCDEIYLDLLDCLVQVKTCDECSEEFTAYGNCINAKSTRYLPELQLSQAQ